MPEKRTAVSMQTAYSKKDLSDSLVLYKQRYCTAFILKARQFCNKNDQWNKFIKKLKRIYYFVLQSDRSLFKDTLFWVWRRVFGIAKCSSTLKMAATVIDPPDYAASHFRQHKISYTPMRELKSVKQFFLLGAIVLCLSWQQMDSFYRPLMTG
jgi:hypothetical protein